MVLVKRKLEYGVNNGYRSTVIPRAPRSIRKRGFRQKSIEGGQVCAFDLLATVAGKLLEESECSSASSSAVVRFDQCGIDKDAVKKEPQDVDKPLGGDHDDQGSSESSVFFSGLQKDTCKGKLETVNEMTGEHASPFVSSTISEKVDSDSKLVTQKYDETYVKDSCKIDGGSPKCGESDDTNDIDNRFIRHLDTNGVNFGDITTTNKSPAPTISEENVELIPCRCSTPNPNASLNHGNNVKRNCKDDDEILFQYSQPNNTTKVYRSPSAADCKLLTSKYWEIAPKLKDYELSDTDDGAKYIDSAKRSCYDVDRSQRNTPFKKRRLIDRSSVVTYDGGISCESVSNSPEKGIGDEKNGSARKLHEGKGTPSSGFCRQKSFKSRNSQVRLSIKSFKVPELFIDVPESTTVDSLKRTVLETVTTILGGGLRVGVLLHGKKIRDDNRTLLQSGIAQSDDMGTVEFMFEPNSPTQPSPPKGREEPPAPPSCDSPKFVNRSRVNTNDDTFVINTPEKPSVTDANRSSGTGIKNFVPSLTAELTNKNVSDSKALVPVPEASVRALAVVPVNHRSKCADIGQRRTRRPFSVSEVEALVRAVENLGTGRWRDVKLCAFENAKHRTYVDLKDKWKTLVHTARISPQQRRGEPVPQELLDRVLAAQSYWSEHQAKQHGKHHQQQGIIPQLTDAIVGEA